MMITLWLGLALSVGHSAPASSCKALLPIEAGQMTPEGLKAWIAGNGSRIKTVEDLVCCLPKGYLTDYSVSHASIAGQNGSPESPRVILKRNISAQSIHDGSNAMLLSINGGASYLSQANAVEIGYYRGATKRLEYYDLNVDHQKPELSGANPESCMNCHGDGGKVPPTGPKPIFDPFGDWPRFVGGAVKCTPEEDKIQLQQQKTALKAIRDLPRFKCHDKTGLNDYIDKLSIDETSEMTGGPVGSFASTDAFLFGANNARVARLARETKDYEAYKYAIAGSEQCNDFAEKLNEWIPAQVRAEHNHMSTVDSILDPQSPKTNWKKVIDYARAQGQAHKDYIKNNFSTLMTDMKHGLDPAEVIYSCDNRKLRDAEEALEAQTTMGNVLNVNLEKYFGDALLKQKPLQIRGATNYDLRYLFEGRGIDMGNWTMEPTQGKYRMGLEISADLVDLEPANSEMRKRWKERDAKEAASAMNEEGIKQIEDAKFCAYLKKASYSSLEKLYLKTHPSANSSEASH